MKLDAQATAELTGLTPKTVMEYARRLGVGKIEGRKKVFTKAEAKLIGSGKTPKPVAKKKPATRSRTAAKRPARGR